MRRICLDFYETLFFNNICNKWLLTILSYVNVFFFFNQCGIIRCFCMFMQGTLCAGGIYGSVNEAFTLHSVLLKRQY